MYNVSMVVAQTSVKQQTSSRSSGVKKTSDKKALEQPQSRRYKTLSSACTNADSISVNRLLMKILLGIIVLIILVAVGLCSQIFSSDSASGYSRYGQNTLYSSQQ